MKPLLSAHPRDLPKCRLKRGCPLNRGFKNCAKFVNDKHSTVTLCCEEGSKEAKEAVLYFLQDFKVNYDSG